MALVTAKGLVHFSLPANDVEESLKFYTEVLGMEYRGKVGATGRCVRAGDVNIILVGRPNARPFEELEEHNTQLCHQAFYVSSEDYDRALESFQEHGVRVSNEEYRKTGTFTGRSFYFFDPTGNRLEINDPHPPYWPEDAR
ncbi:MAG TPA: VOC family protein [Chloroflexota bacterium]|nr:VOC family protein [Chloroflexota bacterium]